MGRSTCANAALVLAGGLIATMAAGTGCGSYFVPVQVASSTLPVGEGWHVDKVIGPAKASRCDPANSLRDTLDDAIRSAPGANALIDVAVEIHVKPHWFIVSWFDRCTVVKGTAVRLTKRSASSGAPATAGEPGAAPVAEALAAPAGEAGAPGTAEDHAGPGPCERQIQEICSCDGPPRQVVEKACREAKKRQRDQRARCAGPVSQVRDKLRCLAPAGK